MATSLSFALASRKKEAERGEGRGGEGRGGEELILITPYIVENKLGLLNKGFQHLREY